MMSLQLGETFSGFKINPLLFKHNELPKIFLPPTP